MSFKKNILTLILIIFAVNQLFAQNDSAKVQQNIYNDTIRYQNKKNSSKLNTALSFAIPSALITYGIITRFSSTLQSFDHNIAGKVQANVSRRYSFDDYIQFLPYVAVYGLDLCGVKAKHTFVERTLVVGTSALIMGTTVILTKNLTHIQRPDQSDFQSFPSGHTATAFMGADILFREYKDVSPFIGIAGYAVAVATGTMRIINNKHWFSDVITGAGVGVLSAELSYLMLPLWQKAFKLKSRNSGLAVTPIINRNQLCLGGVWVF